MEAYEVLTDPMRRTEYESASFSAVMRSATSEILQRYLQILQSVLMVI